MTNRDKCIAAWEYISTQSEYDIQEFGSFMLEVFNEEVLGTKTCINDCWACQETADNNDGFMDCTQCPVVWTDNGKPRKKYDSTCLNKGSTYKVFLNDLSRKTACDVLVTVKNTWKEK